MSSVEDRARDEGTETQRDKGERPKTDRKRETEGDRPIDRESERQRQRERETVRDRDRETARHRCHTEASEAVPASWPREDPGEARSLECHTANRGQRSSRQEAENTLWGDLAAGSGQRKVGRAGFWQRQEGTAQAMGCERGWVRAAAAGARLCDISQARLWC